MKKLQVGIMSRNKFQSRAIDIACGRYKPKKNEPKIWFNTLESLCEVLNENNMELLKIIDELKPRSIDELAVLSKCEPGNLVHALSTMAHYGIIEMKKIGENTKPIAKALDFNVQYSAAG